MLLLLCQLLHQRVVDADVCRILKHGRGDGDVLGVVLADAFTGNGLQLELLFFKQGKEEGTAQQSRNLTDTQVCTESYRQLP